MKAGVICQQLMQSLQLEVCTTKILSVFNKWWTSTSAEAHSSLHSTLQYSNFKQGESLSLQIFKFFFKIYEMITYNNNSAVLSWNNPKLDRKLFLSEIINSVFVHYPQKPVLVLFPREKWLLSDCCGVFYFFTQHHKWNSIPLFVVKAWHTWNQNFLHGW